MSRLEEIKQEYAQECSYANWDDFINDQPPYSIEHATDVIAIRYSKACCKASLEKASESGRVEAKNPKHSPGFRDCYQIDKESITNPDNIVLL